VSNAIAFSSIASGLASLVLLPWVFFIWPPHEGTKNYSKRCLWAITFRTAIVHLGIYCALILLGLIVVAMRHTSGILAYWWIIPLPEVIPIFLAILLSACLIAKLAPLSPPAPTS